MLDNDKDDWELTPEEEADCRLVFRHYLASLSQIDDPDDPGKKVMQLLQIECATAGIVGDDMELMLGMGIKEAAAIHALKPDISLVELLFQLLMQLHFCFPEH